MIKQEFDLSEKIGCPNGTDDYWIRKEDVKEFISQCRQHSFSTDEGINVIDINKLQELAGKAFL